MSLIKFLAQVVCLFASAMFALTGLASAPTQVIGGGYTDKDKQMHPLLAISYDNGNSFNLVREISGFPTAGYPFVHVMDGAPFTITSVSCLVGYCAATGRYGKNVPFLFSSHNQGSNWINETNIVNFPEKFTILEQVSCRNHHCIAVGGSVGGATLFASGKEGQNWVKINEIAGLPSITSISHLKKSRCVNNICLAVGTRFENGYTNKFPLIVISKDYGQSWYFPNDLPANIKLPSLNDVTCTTNNTCIAVGEQDKSALILFSKDSGLSWTPINQISNLPKFKTHMLKTVSCSGNTCVAFGNYKDGKNWEDEKTYPLILVSRDYGASWSYMPKVPRIDSAPFDLVASQVYCQGSTCIAVGIAYGDGNKAVLLVSNNRSQSWAEVKKFNNMPANMEFMLLRSVRVMGSFATIVGSYKIKGSWVLLPLVLTSHDSGRSWRFTTIDGLPADIKGGELTTSWL